MVDCRCRRLSRSERLQHRSTAASPCPRRGIGKTPQQVVDVERDGLVSMGGATNLMVTPATVLIVVGPFVGDTFAATVTAQTTDEGNADCQRDTRTFLDGFQMGPVDKS